MTKDSKTATTIRRKKGKEVAMALHKLKEENAKPTTYVSEQELAATEAQDNCTLFDDQVLGPTMLRWLMSHDRSLFLALLVIRLANALIIQTQYVPDEYWQSLEVSHHMVFGYGYLTWEWRQGLRGYLYPLVFAVFYKILYVLGLDSRTLLIKVPRLVQATIAAWGEFRLYKLSFKLAGRAVAQWTLVCHLLSWFTMYCCTRTLSNSVETALVSAALSYFPWPNLPSHPKTLYKFLLLAALSVLVRPTAALVWVLVCSWLLQRSYGTVAFDGILRAYVLSGSVAFSFSLVIDRVWYGRWICVQLNFLCFNLSGGANMYGVHPWHWYLSQGFPVVLGTLTLPFLVGAWRARDKTLLWIILWVLATHSFLSHKEFRFIMPTIPLCCHYCGVYFQTLCSKPPLRKFAKSAEKSISNADTEDVQDTNSSDLPDTSGDIDAEAEPVGGSQDETFTSGFNKRQTKFRVSSSGAGDSSDVSNLYSQLDPSSAGDTEAIPGKSHPELVKDVAVDELGKTTDTVSSPVVLRDQHHQLNLKKARLLVLLLAVSNLLPALYFSLIHQRGTVLVSKFLYQTSFQQPSADVLFLMPCHSTPYHSYIHRNITMRFLTCEPNLSGAANYTDEADLFYQDPNRWLQTEYVQAKKPWPSIVVYFDILHKQISESLVLGGYRVCEQIFHAHFPQGRVGTNVIISCR